MKKICVKMTAALAALAIAAGIPAASAFAAAPSAHEVQADAFRERRELDRQSMNNVYLLPDSDTYYISESDISWMDDNELMLARNEFYARRGRKFVTKSIQEYFSRQGWYEGRIEPEDFTSDLFNRYEQANVDFIVAYENRRREVREQKEKEKRERKKAKKTKKEVNVLDSSENSESSSLKKESVREVCALYRDAIRQEWDEEDCELAGVNRLVLGLSDPDELGYAFRDLDDDGEQEFLIGPTDVQLYGEGAVFAIYAFEDGLPVIVASSDENSMYYVCSDNTLCREMTDEDGTLEIAYLDLAEGGLICKSAIVMNEGIDAEEPWFIVQDPEEGWEDTMLAEGTMEFNGLDAITYEEASKARSAYVAESLDLTPLEIN